MLLQVCRQVILWSQLKVWKTLKLNLIEHIIPIIIRVKSPLVFWKSKEEHSQDKVLWKI